MTIYTIEVTTPSVTTRQALRYYMDSDKAFACLEEVIKTQEKIFGVEFVREAYPGQTTLNGWVICCYTAKMGRAGFATVEIVGHELNG